MKKIIKKGLEIIDHADGTKTYKPYVIIDGLVIGKKQYISSYNGEIYYFDTRGYCTRDSESYAIKLLNETIDRFERNELEKKNKEVVNTYDKEIK